MYGMSARAHTSKKSDAFLSRATAEIPSFLDTAEKDEAAISYAASHSRFLSPRNTHFLESIMRFLSEISHKKPRSLQEIFPFKIRGISFPEKKILVIFSIILSIRINVRHMKYVLVLRIQWIKRGIGVSVFEISHPLDVIVVKSFFLFEKLQMQKGDRQ